MEENEYKSIPGTNAVISIDFKNEHITVLDLSHTKLTTIHENLQLPENLIELNLSHNNLTEIPAKVQNHTKLKLLNVSYNEIKYFDDTPKFSHSIEVLNLSNNKLLGPPYWIWAENLKNIKVVNLSCNNIITHSFVNGYFEELLVYRTQVTQISMYNCNLNKKYLQLLQTLPLVKAVNLGTAQSNSRSANYIEEFPSIDWNGCIEIETLNLINTGIFKINANISIYKHLKEIDLSLNGLSGLPDEFCSLGNLEVCILSFNNLLHLPDNFGKLEKLFCLSLNNNCLCMLPENLCTLPFLKKLDLYDNNLYEIPEGINNLLEVDLAQNYFDEPIDEGYVGKKKKIRIKSAERYNGRKIENEKAESEYSEQNEDNEFCLTSESEVQDVENRPISDQEDWDSDEVWIPHRAPSYSATQSPWMYFVKRKMREGNFCPMDAHQIPVAEQVEYEKYCNPTTTYESDGQFEDCSSDED